MFKQCDARWAKQIMQNATICRVGCFMSSISMALNGRSIAVPTINGSTVEANPSTLDTWLQTHSGFIPIDILDAATLPHLSLRISLGAPYMHRTNDLTYQQVSAFMDAGKVVVANVLRGTHFVLLTAHLSALPLTANMSSNSYLCNDPGFLTTSYIHADITGFRIFSISS